LAGKEVYRLHNWFDRKGGYRNSGVFHFEQHLVNL